MTMRKVGFLLAVAALWVTACSDSSTAPPASPNHLLGGGLLGDDLLSDAPLLPSGLLTCDPLPYASVTKTIGPRGGEIEVGPHVLRIPRGALDDDVTVTAEAPSDTVNVVRFDPHGLRFAKPARLAMSYANCNVDGLLTLPKKVAYVNDLLAILYILESADDIEEERVTARLDHFSGYALSW